MLYRRRKVLTFLLFAGVIWIGVATYQSRGKVSDRTEHGRGREEEEAGGKRRQGAEENWDQMGNDEDEGEHDHDGIEGVHNHAHEGEHNHAEEEEGNDHHNNQHKPERQQKKGIKAEKKPKHQHHNEGHNKKDVEKDEDADIEGAIEKDRQQRQREEGNEENDDEQADQADKGALKEDGDGNSRGQVAEQDEGREDREEDAEADDADGEGERGDKFKKGKKGPLTEEEEAQEDDDDEGVAAAVAADDEAARQWAEGGDGVEEGDEIHDKLAAHEAAQRSLALKFNQEAKNLASTGQPNLDQGGEERGKKMGNAVIWDGGKQLPEVAQVGASVGAAAVQKRPAKRSRKIGQAAGEQAAAEQGTLTIAGVVGGKGGEAVRGEKTPARRYLADVRDRMCLEVGYGSSLPSASVIIVFYNEEYNTLLRSLHSVLDRSPDKQLAEVLLIDDFSDTEELKTQLSTYISTFKKVHLVRNTERLGVTASRQRGASEAVGAVLVFLDSHTECTNGWLEPLLSRISENRLNVVTPVIDIIDDVTYTYKPFDLQSINIGGFDWNLQFTWISVPDQEKKRKINEIDPIRTPTMSGMFAIDRTRFEELGGFDVGMDEWGGENLEMSFKTWMCGGTLETIPCSHVGHLFSKSSTHKMSPRQGGNPRKNQLRLAEVWMDEHKLQYYLTIGKAVGSFGDVSERVKLREKLKCKSFGWYLKNIYPQLFVPSHALASGQIRNKEQGFGDGRKFSACIDSIVGPNAYEKPVQIWPCHDQGGNQIWLLSKSGEIRRENSCFDYAGKAVVVYPCHGQRGNQQWDYYGDNTIRHVGTKLCLQLTEDSRSIGMGKCDRSDKQIWFWKRSKELTVSNRVGNGDGAGGEGQAPIAPHDNEDAPEQELAKPY